MCVNRDFAKDAVDLIKHNENTLTQRANTFLLGESFLVAGYATTLDGLCDALSCLYILRSISILGLIISLFWWCYGDRFCRNTGKLLTVLKDGRCDNIKECYLIDRDIFTKYLRWRDSCISGSNELFGKIIPACFIVLWAAFLILK